MSDDAPGVAPMDDAGQAAVDCLRERACDYEYLGRPDDVRRCRNAADALEVWCLALAARCEAAEAERDRLRAALSKAHSLANSATSNAEQAAEVMGEADFDLARELVDRAATDANDAWIILDAALHGDGA